MLCLLRTPRQCQPASPGPGWLAAVVALLWLSGVTAAPAPAAEEPLPLAAAAPVRPGEEGTAPAGAADAERPEQPDRAANSGGRQASPLVEKTKQKPVQAGRRAGGKKGKRRGTPPCLAWIDPDVPPRAALLCVHGLGLYNGTYEPFGLRMSRLGFATYAIDMRGFGSWMEAKGREKVDFDACLADVEAVLKVVHRAHPGLPVFLLGESMGGAIGLQSAAAFPDLIDGLISSVPAGDRFQQKRTALKVALRLLKNPDQPFDVGTGVIKQATQKPELRKAWSTDPLARLNLSPKELIQFQRFMNQNHDAAREIKSIPVLIVQGCNDRLVRPEGTVELYNQIASPDRQLILVPNAEHLIFEEGQFTDEVVETVSAWMDARIGKPAAQAPQSLNK